MEGPIQAATSVHLPARPICTLSTLYGLSVSRRCSRQTAKEPRPAGIPVLLGGAGASPPQRQEALPYLCDWERGACGWENTKTATAKQSAAGPNPRWMRKKEKRKRSAEGPEPEKNTGDFRSNYSKPASHPYRRQADGAKPATWAATLDPSQAGAMNGSTWLHKVNKREWQLVKE